MQDPTNMPSIDPTDQALQQQIYSQSLQNSVGLLGQINQANLQAGMNPEIAQAQYAGNRSVLDAGRQMIGTPAAPAQDWSYDPNNMAAQKYSALLAMGPQSFMGHGAPLLLGNNSFMPAGSPASLQVGMRDWNQALDHAAFDAHSSFNGGGNTQMDPAQYQQAQNQAQMQQLASGQGLLQSVKPTTAIDPANLMGLAKNQADVASSVNQYRGNAAQAMGNNNKALLEQMGKSQAATIQATGRVTAAQVNAQARNAGEKPPNAIQTKAVEQMGNLKQNYQEAEQLAAIAKPEFFNKPYQLSQDGNSFVDKVTGKPVTLSPEEMNKYQAFQSLGNSMLNNYAKSITPRALSNPNAMAQLRKGFIDPGQDYESWKAHMADAMTRYALATGIQQQLIKNGADQGKLIKIGDQGLEDDTSTALNGIPITAYQSALNKVLAKNPGLQPGNQVPPAAQNPANPSVSGQNGVPIPPQYQSPQAAQAAKAWLAAHPQGQ